MKIIIIDDDIEIILKLEEILNKYFEDKKIGYEIITINDRFDDFNDYDADIYFLDINLGDDNGIKLAKRIRNNIELGLIVFVSSHNDLVFDTLEVQPLHFVRKNNLENDITICLKTINKHIESHFKYVTLALKGKTVDVQLNDIIYIESYVHHITVITKNDRFTHRYSFNTVMKSINSPNICRIHKSYAVNLYWLKEIYDNRAILKNGVELLVGDRYKERLMNAYKKYLLNL